MTANAPTEVRALPCPLSRFEKTRRREEGGVTLGTEGLFGYNYLEFDTYVYFYFGSRSF